MKNVKREKVLIGMTKSKPLPFFCILDLCIQALVDCFECDNLLYRQGFQTP